MNTKIIIPVIIALLFVAPDPAPAQWIEVTSYPSQFHSNHFLDIYFLESDQRFGWICGFGGTVLYTTDGGENWMGTRIPNGGQLESIYFPTRWTGYVSGAGRIFKSTDGGATWRDVSPSSAYAYDIWGNFFLTEDIGMAIGGGCGYNPQHFFRTTDGGQTWSQATGSVIESGMCDLILYSADGLGYASSSGLIWRTTDGGNSWSVFSASGERDWQEEIAHTGNSFLVPYSTGCMGNGGSGGARMTTDMGQNWRETEFGFPMFGSFLLDEKRGWVVGWNATAAFTSDGGKTWENYSCGLQGKDMDDIWFVNDTLGWLVGEGIYRTYQPNTIVPEILTDKDLLCPGDSVTLRTRGDYRLYRWSTGETTPTITVAQPGEYSVFVKDDSCAKGESQTIIIDIAPEPDITLNFNKESPLCEGDTLWVSLVEDHPFRNWSHLPPADNNKSAAITGSGEYGITVTDSNGCEATKFFEVDFVDSPDPALNVIGDDNICDGETMILTATEGYAKYTWYESGRRIDSGKNSIGVTASGTYSVYIENSEGCGAWSDERELVFRNDSNRVEILMSASPPEVVFDSTRYPDLNCREIMLANTGPDPVVFDYFYIKQNLSFSAPQSQFPLVIPPYDSAGVRVCYSPRNIGAERDTAIIFDICGNHYIPLLAWGAENIFTGETRCDMDIVLKTKEIPEGIFDADAPAPNPASDNFSVEFSAFVAENGELPAAGLYNTLGREVAEISPEITEEVSRSEGKAISGEYKIYTSGIASGTYYIIIAGSRRNFVFPVTIVK